MSTPTRTCIACRTRGTSHEMFRLARDKSGACAPGRTAAGRGAWVCSTTCFDRATQQRRWSHALRGHIPTHEFEAVRATLFADFEAK